MTAESYLPESYPSGDSWVIPVWVTHGLSRRYDGSHHHEWDLLWAISPIRERRVWVIPIWWQLSHTWLITQRVVPVWWQTDAKHPRTWCSFEAGSEASWSTDECTTTEDRLGLDLLCPPPENKQRTMVIPQNCCHRDHNTATSGHYYIACLWLFLKW